METIEQVPNREYLEMTFTKETATGRGLNNQLIMEVNNDGTFTMTEGRIGITIGVHKPVKKILPMVEWDDQYLRHKTLGYTLISTKKRETKLKKFDDSVNGQRYKAIEDNDVRQAVDLIISYANNLVKQEYSVKITEISDIMVNLGKEAIDDLASNYENMSVAEFNNKLKVLYAVIPRRIDNLSKSLAVRQSDFADIIAKEQDLYNVMTSSMDYSTLNAADKTILDIYGLEWRVVTEEEETYLKKKLGNEGSRYRRAWRITNTKTEKNFNDYCNRLNFTKENGIYRLFHGSRSENFWSIISNGLTINPTGVVITGKMFGNGTYFAPDACKSMGYTNRTGSRWANGNSKVGYLGLYKVAVGNPCSPSCATAYNYNSLLKQGYHSVWCKRGGQIGLRMDEVVVYQDCQDTIEYLIEVGM